MVRIDDRGRLKVPSAFRTPLWNGGKTDAFVTSLTGQCVRIYPLEVWIDVERKLAAMPANHPSRIKFLDRVNYFGQSSELDAQGRVVIPAHLRESATMVGDVRVFGHINYLEVWNDSRFAERLDREPWSNEDGLSVSEYGI